MAAGSDLWRYALEGKKLNFLHVYTRKIFSMFKCKVTTSNRPWDVRSFNYFKQSYNLDIFLQKLV